MVYKKIGKRSPIKRKYGKKKQAMKRRPTNMPRSLIPSITNKHYAQITETFEETSLMPNSLYFETFHLGNFKRALRVSENFKFYRAKQVLFKYEPIYNLYSEGGESVPLAYFVMNRTQDINASWGKAELEQQGALPRKFTSQITIKYTPNWCSPGLIAQKRDASGNVQDIIQQGVQKCYNWLMCPQDSISAFHTSEFIQASGLTTQGYYIGNNPAAQVIYNGHNMYFDQTTVGSVPQVARRTITVVWEFKGPKTRNNRSPGDTPQEL